MMVRRRQDLICKLSPSRPSRQNQPRAPLRALLALGEARGLPEDDRSASREASSCTPSVEARAAANPMGERDAVARRGGAVRRGGPNGGPALLAGQANRGRDCGCSDRTADSRSGPSRMTQGVVDLARNRKFESVSLQQTVRLSRDFSLRHRKAGSCRGVRGPGQAAPPAETPGARQHHANCR